MKKLLYVGAFLFLAGCSLKAGEYNIFPARGEWVENLSSYPITFWSEEPEVVRVERREERNVEYNVSKDALVGTSVLTLKVYDVKHLRQNLLRANEDAIMNSASIPDIIKANKTYKILGTVVYNGQEFRLVPSSLKGFVFLVDNKGKLFHEMGRVKNGRLTILQTDFVPTPEDVRLYPVKLSKSVQDKPVAGIDIKYDGINKQNQLSFLVIDYDDGFDGKGIAETLTFRNKPGVISIKGNKIKIMQAEAHKLRYMILK